MRLRTARQGVRFPPGAPVFEFGRALGAITRVRHQHFGTRSRQLVYYSPVVAAMNIVAAIVAGCAFVSVGCAMTFNRWRLADRIANVCQPLPRWLKGWGSDYPLTHKVTGVILVGAAWWWSVPEWPLVAALSDTACPQPGGGA